MSEERFFNYTSEFVDTIRTFAKEYWTRIEAKHSGRFNDVHSGRINHTVFGKLAEFAVADLMGTSAPDMEIWVGNERKSRLATADTFDDVFNFHVKSYVKSPRWSESWVVDGTDPAVKAPKSNDWFAFCTVDADTLTVEVVALVRSTAMAGLWKECLAEVLRKKGKKAIYWEDLEAAALVDDAVFLRP